MIERDRLGICLGNCPLLTEMPKRPKPWEETSNKGRKGKQDETTLSIKTRRKSHSCQKDQETLPQGRWKELTLSALLKLFSLSRLLLMTRKSCTNDVNLRTSKGWSWIPPSRGESEKCMMPRPAVNELVTGSNECLGWCMPNFLRSLPGLSRRLVTMDEGRQGSGRRPNEETSKLIQTGSTKSNDHLHKKADVI